MINDKNTANYSNSFQVKVQSGTGKQKDKLEMIFEEDPPQEILDLIGANGFCYDKNRDIWYSYNNYVSRQIADDVLRRSLLPKSIPPKLNPMNLNIKEYKAKNLVPLSSRILVSEGGYHKIFKETAKTAIQIIESVHLLDEFCSPIPIKFTRESDGFAAQFWTHPLKILVYTQKSPRILTIVHEIGHFIDYSLGERIDDWRGKLMATIKRTSGYKIYKNFDPNGVGKVIITDKNGTRVRLRPMKSLDPGAKSRIKECDDVELFARAYEQYIGIKSGQLQSELELETEYRIDVVSGEDFRTITSTRPILWKTEDFKEVEQIFDLFFLDIGWSISCQKNAESHQ